MILKNNIKKDSEHHPFHLVTVSPWPLFSSIFAFQFLIGFVSYLNNYISYLSFFLYFFFISLIAAIWFNNIVWEATLCGYHTKKVQKGLKLGMVLFIASEIMLFFSFFWAFFHSSLAPSIWIGCIWPPIGIDIISYTHLPLLNTIILLSSGVSLTLSHRSLIYGKNLSYIIYSLELTIFLGIYFTILQYIEYNNTFFTINDSVYGSVFYMLTGFHGFHVLLGTFLLIVSLLRLYSYQFFNYQHIGYECAIWYWHFVDVVWIFLYILIYYWGC